MARLPVHERAYTKLLEELFASRLDIVNKPTTAPESSSIPSTVPEFALGKVLAAQSTRNELTKAVRDLLADATTAASIDADLRKALTAWLAHPSDPRIAPCHPSPSH